LNGTIPTELGLFPKIRELFLHGNKLTGSVPSELGLLTTLRTSFSRQLLFVPTEELAHKHLVYRSSPNPSLRLVGKCTIGDLSSSSWFWSWRTGRVCQQLHRCGVCAARVLFRLCRGLLTAGFDPRAAEVVFLGLDISASIDTFSLDSVFGSRPSVSEDSPADTG
jgi:hypothetical protein